MFLTRPLTRYSDRSLRPGLGRTGVSGTTDKERMRSFVTSSKVPNNMKSFYPYCHYTVLLSASIGVDKGFLLL